MRFVSVVACVALMMPLAPVGWAQDRGQTLADIRQELSVLYVDIQQLKRELSTTGAPTGAGGGGSALARLDAIEAQMQQLTSKTEELEYRINRVATDGGNRVGDLEFRLCELETNCDIGKLGETTTLGGSAGNAPAAVVRQGEPNTPELAVGEATDFDRAEAALADGNSTEAIKILDQFIDAYPGSPLTAKVQIARGDAMDNLGEKTGSARAYLEAFSAAPEGPQAPNALFKLGRALGQLGQQSEACVTLSEVGVRFPGSAAVSEAEAERARLGCS
ncbi:tol-pal system protein YbgF [Thalassovita gelatinovora]|uniref:Cell division coordinator CpoB n=1 Tax=Thalassovita gelatinovora TaxID=53501 RepID=A0A0P1FWH5_THAGE|nr:tetratricopeptide repeat protein [Thalassovita gelatinovora]QIZ80333.1 tetratricopeptide repeat protein [Thalassovita gelatinovora]CUH64254.1 tol-pal system protein YbgF [Thalassovita gelatinovora]SEQ94315.1 tol-pal system protein YbgF [Thalassovita gelatinovora]